MLGDVDRKRSVDGWGGRKSTQSPTITSWAVDRSKVLRHPVGTTHVALDTPGALYDYDLARRASAAPRQAVARQRAWQAAVV